MKIGFTGTRKGMTDEQKEEISWMLQAQLGLARAITGKVDEVHHGDCVGADSDFHDLASGYDIVVHPPSVDKYRAFREGSEILPPKSYLQRNMDIVDSCDILIAAPEGEEQQRSGTWATVRYARKRNKSIFIVSPDGIIHPEGPPVNVITK